MDNRVEIVLAAKDITGKAFAKVQGRLKSLSKAVFSFNGALVGVAGAAGLGYFIKKNLEAADSIAKIADSVGVSTKSLQEYRFVAERSGVATAQLDQGLGAFSKRLGELKAGTGALNTMLNKNNKALKEQLIAAGSTDEALDIFLSTLAKIENQSEKTALSAAAFSRTAGIKMTNLVKGGTKGLEGMRKEFADLGLVIDEKFLRQSEKAVDQFTNLEYVIKTRLMGAVVQAAPEITGIVQEMTDWVTANDDFLKQKIPVYIDNTKIAAKGVYDALGDIKSIYDAIPDELKGPTGVGLLGGILFGPKVGVVIGGMSYLVGEFKDFSDGIKGLMAGQISWDEFIGSPADEKKFEEALARYRKYKKDIADIDIHYYPIGSPGNPDTLNISKFPKISPIMDITEDFKSPFVNYDLLNMTDKERRMAFISRDQVDKTKDALKQMEDAGIKTASVWENAFDGWASGFSATLTDMVWEAEFSFKEIATSFGKMITQVMIQKQVIEPLMSFNYGGFFSSFFHDGGIVGADRGRVGTVPAMAFAGAPRLHTGLMPDEFPAILQKGEGVFTAEQMKALGGMNQAPNILIKIDNQTGTPTTARQGETKWDGEKFVIGVFLDALARNKGGFKNNLKAAMAG